jgi:hypothetical protein
VRCVPPGPPRLDQFRLIEAIDGLCQGIVVGIIDRADRRVDPFLKEAVGEPHRRILTTRIIVMNKAGQILDTLAFPGEDCLTDLRDSASAG